jgi:hypothetical protein
LEKQNLQGKVKSITETLFTAIEKFGEVTKGSADSFESSIHNYSLEFNDRGYLIKDSKNSLIIYDNKNNIIEKQNYDMKEIYKYNEEGLLIEINEFLCKNLDSITTKTKYKYDNTNQVEQSIYESNGELSLKIIDSYENKNLISRSVFRSNGTSKGSLYYVYDKNNNEIKSQRLLIDKRGGTLHEEDETKYDENNLVIEIKSKGMNGVDIHKYKYIKFDSNKNWVEKIEYYNGKPKFVIVRKIEYFK